MKPTLNPSSSPAITPEGLQTLIALRTKGYAPNAVWIIVGKTPRWLPDSPAHIVIGPGDTSHDFRAVVGLHVDVFDLGNQECHLNAILGALDASKPKTNGIACKDGVSGLNARHEAMLKRTLELLCTS